MAKQKGLLDDALWRRVEPLLPPAPPRRSFRPGRRPSAPRASLTGILWVLRLKVPWADLPPELGCGTGWTCWRYFKALERAGAWKPIEETLRRSSALSDLPWERLTITRKRESAAKPPAASAGGTGSPPLP